MGDFQVSLSRHLQGSYLGPLRSWPCIPTFMGPQEAPHTQSSWRLPTGGVRRGAGRDPRAGGV